MTRPRASSKADRSRQQTTKTVIAAFCLAGLLAFGILLQVGPKVPNRAPSPAGENDYRTGSILFVPILGNDCRQLLIDNATWQIRDNGAVPCDVAISRSSDAATRVDIIRNGFVGK